jgi:hypothetical protein
MDEVRVRTKNRAGKDVFATFLNARKITLTVGNRPSGAPASTLNLSIAGALATCLNRGAA